MLVKAWENISSYILLGRRKLNIQRNFCLQSLWSNWYHSGPLSGNKKKTGQNIGKEIFFSDIKFRLCKIWITEGKKENKWGACNICVLVSWGLLQNTIECLKMIVNSYFPVLKTRSIQSKCPICSLWSLQEITFLPLPTFLRFPAFLDPVGLLACDSVTSLSASHFSLFVWVSLRLLLREHQPYWI